MFFFGFAVGLCNWVWRGGGMSTLHGHRCLIGARQFASVIIIILYFYSINCIIVIMVLPYWPSVRIRNLNTNTSLYCIYISLIVLLVLWYTPVCSHPEPPEFLRAPMDGPRRRPPTPLSGVVTPFHN